MGQAKVFGSRPQFGAGGTLSEGHAIGAGRSNSRGICTYDIRELSGFKINTCEKRWGGRPDSGLPTRNDEK